mmetsp:Transcript_21722/g.45881  ORF Transcript_21722/g.45881 Transcript_21722/m.45881 type:complete len:366 (-) Transcript_21722:187-1284(-)|eukprot:CAMPEP_0183734842 /NCGR_PEP_ID=MMETSP0737-20130205/44960_1 /TAXON_ID=385413 /ORGANISM="Thalassiosira miniscula, Strain CCMP1093" /LENGTH=365 /DNA_ID=CAMNT_0025968451 /DNA_START=37 /DNA_END=1134 /DNA_ORIENTATION=+
MTSTNTSVIARLLLPDDANPAGNVHGGTTLKLMEEAGMIAATRYMSSSDAAKQSNGNCYAALIRFEHMAFHEPIYVGEVASCTAEIVFTSERSILVEVVVTADNITKGKVRVTNTGWLWYVALTPSAVGPDGEKKDWSVVPVLPMTVPDGGAARKKYDMAKAKYEKRKSSTTNSGEKDDSTKLEMDDEFETFKKQSAASNDGGGRSPAESEQVLCQMVLPGDCGADKVAFGGFVMKLMDNAAGCSAWRHCRTNVVTVSISDMDFVSWVGLGDLCTVRSKVVFASSKSMEIEIVASTASASSGEEDKVVAKALYTFVSLGSDGKVLSVPKLRLESDADMRNAYLGKQRYEVAKRARLAGSKKAVSK